MKLEVADQEKELIISHLGIDVYNIIYEFANDPNKVEKKYAAGLLFMQLFAQYFLKESHKYQLNAPYETITFYTDGLENEIRLILFGQMNVTYLGNECKFISLLTGITIENRIFYAPSVRFRIFINDKMKELESIHLYTAAILYP